MQLKQSYLTQHSEIFIYSKQKMCANMSPDRLPYLYTHTHTHRHRHVQNVSLREVFLLINGFIGQHENLKQKYSIIHIKNIQQLKTCVSVCV